MSNEAPTDALRLVPVEPTSAMIQEGLAAYWKTGDDMGSIKSAYAAMLAAAPASPLPGGGLPADVVRLVIAARRVAYEGAAEDDLRALDIAAEAFASRVPWDDEPDEIPAAPIGDA